MIYLVLDAFIETTKSKYRTFIIVEMLLLIIIVIFLLLSYAIHILFVIGACITMISFFVILISKDVQKRKQVQHRYSEYDKRLNELASILSSFSFFNVDNVSGNWYSADRIKYLIKMCDNLIHQNSEENNVNLAFLKPSIIAIIGFGAGVLAEKATLEINLTIGFIALTVVILIYCFGEIKEILNNILFKSNSSEEIMKLKSALMDLLMRDFSESDGLEFGATSNA